MLHPSLTLIAYNMMGRQLSGKFVTVGQSLQSRVSLSSVCSLRYGNLCMLPCPTMSGRCRQCTVSNVSNVISSAVTADINKTVTATRDNGEVDSGDKQPNNATSFVNTECHPTTLLQSSHMLHKPVFVKEIVDLVNPEPGQVIVDMTFGAGGHTRALLKHCPDVTIYALDRDPSAYDLAVKLSSICQQVRPLLGRFSDLRELLHRDGVTCIDAAVLDAGTSSMQFDSSQRGFSLSHDGPLDMRMDGDRLTDQCSAEDVVNNLDANGLYEVIKKYGEEKHARVIAQAIVDNRYSFGRITTTAQFANVIASAFQGQATRLDKLGRRSHVATKTFQALRIFVNDELNQLHNGVEILHSLLRSGGICAVISFHSLEDRIVKRLFHDIDMDAKFNMSITDRYKESSMINHVDDIKRFVTNKKWNALLDRKAITPTEEEVKNNPRARSARLRAATKL